MCSCKSVQILYWNMLSEYRSLMTNSVPKAKFWNSLDWILFQKSVSVKEKGFLWVTHDGFVIWVGKGLRRSLVQPPAESSQLWALKWLFRAFSCRVLKTFKDGDCITSLGNLCPCLFLLISSPYVTSCPQCLIFPPGTTVAWLWLHLLANTGSGGCCLVPQYSLP